MTTPCEFGVCACPAASEYRCDPSEPYMCGPCQKVLLLDKKMNEIRMLLAGLNDERQVLQEKAVQHHDHPFDITHSLPPEIVAHIFEVCIAEGHDSLRWNKCKIPLPLILTAVCQRWRIIAHSTPRLWNTFSLLLQLEISSSSPTQSTLPLLIKEWINRTGELPLSIKLKVIIKHRVIATTMQEIINVLRHCSNRWINLEYNGPPEILAYILSHEQDLPQLRTLHINGNVLGAHTEDAFNIHAKRLTALSITHIRLAWVLSFDWNHLTHLVMEYASPSECFEALLKAPCLTHCTFRHSRKGSVDDEFSLPQNPIVQHTIQYLEISHAEILHERIFHHLSCPSLKTLFLDGTEMDWGVEMAVIVEFLRRSGCSLERLSLVHPQLSTLSDVASLCYGIPTLQHLNAHFYGARASVTGLLAHLEEFSTVDGRKEPRCLPALRSLTLNSDTFSEWTMLPNIFGTSTLHSIELERHRHSLESVKIFVQVGSRKLVPDLVHEGHEEMLKKILQLREAGVKLEVQFKDSKKDGIDLAVEQYYGAKAE